MEKLTETEVKIMKEIWNLSGQEGERTFRSHELADALKKKGCLYHRTTVSTYLIHLANKGYVETADKNENRSPNSAHDYRAAISMKEYRKQRTKNYLHFFYEGDAGRFLDDLSD